MNTLIYLHSSQYFEKFPIIISLDTTEGGKRFHQVIVEGWLLTNLTAVFFIMKLHPNHLCDFQSICHVAVPHEHDFICQHFFVTFIV